MSSTQAGISSWFMTRQPALSTDADRVDGVHRPASGPPCGPMGARNRAGRFTAFHATACSFPSRVKRPTTNFGLDPTGPKNAPVKTAARGRDPAPPLPRTKPMRSAMIMTQAAKRGSAPGEWPSSALAEGAGDLGSGWSSGRWVALAGRRGKYRFDGRGPSTGPPTRAAGQRRGVARAARGLPASKVTWPSSTHRAPGSDRVDCCRRRP